MRERALNASPVLETERLTLRPLTLEDHPVVFRFNSEAAALRHIARVPYVDPAEGEAKTRDYVGMMAAGKAMWWVVELKKGGEAIGYGGLFCIEADSSKAEVGYGLPEQHWGRGYMSEAVAAMVDFGFQELELHRIFGRVDPANAPSARILEKLGFNNEGLARESEFAGGRYHSTNTWARLNPGLELRPLFDHDLDTLFTYENEPEGIRMAAFTREDPADKEAYLAHWAKVRADESITIRTILWGGRVAGSILCHGWFGDPEISYWVGREFWGQGIASLAVQRFLEIVSERPVFARVVADNHGSTRVLEKAGFKEHGRERGFAHGRGAEVEEIVFRLP